MKYRWIVGALFITCFFLLPPYISSGQQDSHQSYWQGATSPASPVQSPSRIDSSQRPVAPHVQPTAPLHPQRPLVSETQASGQNDQPRESSAQQAERPSTQEIPAMWPQAQPPAASTQAQPVQSAVASVPAHVPGYSGLSIRNFYRERFCMHALTIQGAEVVAVAPDSPAARAGLRPAKGLSAREVATATVAGLLTLSPVAPLASSFVRAAGGVDHGDIVLAVNGKRVKAQEDFQRELMRFGPHAVVYLTVRRGEEVLQIPVRLDDWPAPTAVAFLQ